MPYPLGSADKNKNRPQLPPSIRGGHQAAMAYARGQFQHLDKKSLTLARMLLENPDLHDSAKPFLASVLSYYEERGFITKPQREAIKKIVKGVIIYKKDRALMDRIFTLIPERDMNADSIAWLNRTSEFLDSRHELTIPQREQVARIYVSLTEGGLGKQLDDEESAQAFGPEKRGNL
jgi:hypothetical protein